MRATPSARLWSAAVLCRFPLDRAIVCKSNLADLLRSVSFPNLFDRAFGIESVWTGIAFGIGPIPPRPIRRTGSHHSAAGHFQMSNRIGIFDPFPSVAQPIVSLVFRQKSEPGDFVPAPYKRRFAWLAWITPAEIVKLHQVRQMLARPAARRDSAFAPLENRVRVANAKDTFVRLVRYFDSPQRKRMEIK